MFNRLIKVKIRRAAKTVALTVLLAGLTYLGVNAELLRVLETAFI